MFASGLDNARGLNKMGHTFLCKRSLEHILTWRTRAVILSALAARSSIRQARRGATNSKYDMNRPHVRDAAHMDIIV